MSAFISLIFFIIIAALSMVIVAYMNYKEKKDYKRREQLNLLKIQLEELENIVIAIDSICENRAISRLVNDDIIDLYHSMIELEPKASYLQAGQTIAQTRAQELANESPDRIISHLCHSDAQMAKTKHYCQQVIKMLNQQHGKGKIPATELNALTQELQWINLRVDVVSFIAFGHKAYSKNDVLTANAFYKKAQTALMRSNHPDERRTRMIKQVADMLFGRRKSLDEDLMPETEFNPEREENKAPTADDTDGADLDSNDHTSPEMEVSPELLHGAAQSQQGLNAPPSH